MFLRSFLRSTSYFAVSGARTSVVWYRLHAGSTDSPVLRTLTPDSPPTASRTIAGRTLS